MPANRIQNRADRLWAHQRRRAAAEKDRGYLPARRARRDGFDFAGERARESLLVDRGMPDMAVEIAVRAFRQAKWPMHVNAEGFAFLLARRRPGARISQGRSPPA